MKEILVIMAQNLKLQRLYSYYKQQLGLVSNLSTKNNILNRLTAPLINNVDRQNENNQTTTTNNSFMKPKSIPTPTESENQGVDSISNDVPMEFGEEPEKMEESEIVCIKSAEPEPELSKSSEESTLGKPDEIIEPDTAKTETQESLPQETINIENLKNEISSNEETEDNNLKSVEEKIVIQTEIHDNEEKPPVNDHVDVKVNEESEPSKPSTSDSESAIEKS